MYFSMRVIRSASEGVVSTEMGVTFDFGFRLHGSQTVHDSAGIDRLLRYTPLSKRSQLLFEMNEFSNTFIDVRNVLVEDRIDGATTICRLVRQVKQRMNFFLAHVQCPAIAYETQAFNVFGPNPISDLLRAIVAWLPRLAIAIIIVVIACLQFLFGVNLLGQLRGSLR